MRSRARSRALALHTLGALSMLGCDSQEPAFLDINVNAGTVPEGVLIEAYYASGAPTSMPIATPDVLAGRVPAATVAMNLSGGLLAATSNRGPVEFRMRAARGFEQPMYIGVLALGQTGTAGGAWSGPIEEPDNFTLELRLDITLRPERWGTASPTGQCFRLNTGAFTVYVTRESDPDCDGLVDSQDSQPYAYCDPAAPSGPAHDACL